MKLSSLILSVAAGATAIPSGLSHTKRACKDLRDAPVTRSGASLLLGGESWKAVGPNVYWLGLDENVTPPAGEPYYAPFKASYPTLGRITEIMAVTKALGGTAIRAHTLGVSTGNPLSVMPTLGELNEQAFDTIDWAVYQAREYGLRLLVPLTDNYDYYHGGKYNFLRWAGFNLSQSADSGNPLVQQFYTNETIIASFKDYIQKLITHVNPYTNLTYAEDPTIFAYESGNELAGPVWADQNVPPAWIEEIGVFVKSLAPTKLFVDGTYGINKTHLGIDAVDIFSNHFYPVNVTILQSDLNLVASVNKPYFAGEYDWTGLNGKTAPAGDSLDTWFRTLEQSPVAAGSAFWSLFGHNVPDCTTFVNHTDGFTMQYGNPANTDYTNGRIQLVREHQLILSSGDDVGANAALPAVQCPASSTGDV